MKTFTLTALALTAFAGAASAMTTDADVAKIGFYAPGADVQSLTDAQVASLLSVIHSGDSQGEIRGKVRAALN